MDIIKVFLFLILALIGILIGLSIIGIVTGRHSNNKRTSVNLPLQQSPQTRSGASSNFLPKNKAEAHSLAKQWLPQAEQSVRILNTTKNPEIFFKRLDFLFDTLERLQYCERWLSFNGTKPSIMLADLTLSQHNEIELFILRYAQDTRLKIYNLSTKSARENRANAYYKIVSEYMGYLNESNVALVEEQYKLLKTLATTP